MAGERPVLGVVGGVLAGEAVGCVEQRPVAPAPGRRGGVLHYD